LKELYAVPEEVEPLTALAIGVAGDAASLPEPLKQRELAPRSRKPLSQLVFAERYGRPAPLGD
jgi:hypothetical protein